MVHVPDARLIAQRHEHRLLWRNWKAMHPICRKDDIGDALVMQNVKLPDDRLQVCHRLERDYRLKVRRCEDGDEGGDVGHNRIGTGCIFAEREPLTAILLLFSKGLQPGEKPSRHGRQPAF